MNFIQKQIYKIRIRRLRRERLTQESQTLRSQLADKVVCWRRAAVVSEMKRRGMTTPPMAVYL